jgi:hypothetical protein
VSERNVRVHVEHCDRRVFRDHEYVQVRAFLSLFFFVPISLAPVA